MPTGYYQQQAGLGPSDPYNSDPYMDEAQQRALLQGPQAPQAPSQIGWQGTVGGRNITQYGAPRTDAEMLALLQNRSDFQNTGVTTGGRPRSMDDAAYWAAVHPNATPDQIANQDQLHNEYVDSGIMGGKKGWRGWALNNPLGVIAGFGALAAGGAGLSTLLGGGSAAGAGAGAAAAPGATGGIGSSIGSGLSSGFSAGAGTAAGTAAGTSVGSAAGLGAGAGGLTAGIGNLPGELNTAFQGMTTYGGGGAGQLAAAGGIGGGAGVGGGIGGMGAVGNYIQNHASTLAGLLGGGQQQAPMMGSYGGGVMPGYQAPQQGPTGPRQMQLPTDPGMPLTPQGRRARNFLGSTIWM